MINIRTWIEQNGLTYANAASLLKCSVTRAHNLYHEQTKLTPIELVRMRSNMGQWSSAWMVRKDGKYVVRIGEQVVPLAYGYQGKVKMFKICRGFVYVKLVNERHGEAAVISLEF
jgi:hypothetical protein